MKQSAYNYCIFLLSKREYSTKSITDKMKQKDIPEKEIQETIEKLKKLKFLDDKRFADIFVRNKSDINKWGERKIKMELSIKHNITNDIVDEIIEENNINFEDEKTKCYIKKYGYTLPEDSREYQKRMAFLARRGYNPKLPSKEELNLE